MGDHHTAPGSEWGTFELIPRMLRNIDRVSVFRRECLSFGVTHGNSTDLRSSPQVSFEQGRRESLGGGEVVKVAQISVRWKPSSRVDLNPEKLVYDPLVLRTIETLEAAYTRIWIRDGRSIHHRFKSFDERV